MKHEYIYNACSEEISTSEFEEQNVIFCSECVRHIEKKAAGNKENRGLSILKQVILSVDATPNVSHEIF